MRFKTLELQLYEPTRKKREILDSAMLNYSQALEYLLRCHGAHIKELACLGRPAAKKELLSLATAENMKQLNTFGIQPFKDSIKMEFAGIAAAFIAQYRGDPKTGFPSVNIDDRDYYDTFDSLIRNYDKMNISKREFAAGVTTLLRHSGRLHMLYFGRYAANRDYCLLYDELTGRFYAKLYILNRQSAMPCRSVNDRLRYVSAGTPLFETDNGPVRYLVFPLMFGEYQKSQLMFAIEHPGVLHTARLLKRGSRYFLLLSMECVPGRRLPTSTTLGVARTACALHYTVMQTGKMISEGVIEYVPGRTGLFGVTKQIRNLALTFKSQVVLESGGGKNDGLAMTNMPLVVNSQWYQSLAKILSYKLWESGLPAPVEVSPNGLYNTCPECGAKTRKNRLSEKIFACTQCGYACRLDEVGSASLAGILRKYEKDKIPVLAKDAGEFINFTVAAIGFDFTMKAMDDHDDYSLLYYELNLYVHSLDIRGQSNKAYYIVKKILAAENISDVVKIVSARRNTRLRVADQLDTAKIQC